MPALRVLQQELAKYLGKGEVQVAAKDKSIAMSDPVTPAPNNNLPSDEIDGNAKEQIEALLTLAPAPGHDPEERVRLMN